ncbi:MAG: hypothetical protein Q9190_001809 [Brigantiaea leucoxantha]
MTYAWSPKIIAEEVGFSILRGWMVALKDELAILERRCQNQAATNNAEDNLDAVSSNSVPDGGRVLTTSVGRFEKDELWS